MFGDKPGQTIIELTETDSTNSYAARLLDDEFPAEGTLIKSLYQQSGRGLRGSKWESERGKNLLISYILYPNFLPVHDQFYLNQAVALSLQETIQSFTTQKIDIKWPNDILAAGKKIAGILIENTIRSEKITHSIAGAGINVNQQSFSGFTPEATSLALLEKKTFDHAAILKVLNNSLDKWYNQLRMGNYSRISESYLNCLYLLQTESKFESEGTGFRGKITGIKEDGSLEILRDDDVLLNFKNKEVKFLF